MATDYSIFTGGTAPPAKLNTPSTTTTIPNPLNAYASYTYSWTLWWLSVSDYNNIMAQGNAIDAMSYQLTSSGVDASYVIAEDGGLYPDRRLPQTLGLNYQIQDVAINSIISLNSQSASSNTLTGEITILEQYGCTLVDSMIAASFDNTSGNGFINYTQQPYLLELNFTGYDDSGNPILDPPPLPLKKRFPIQIVNLSVEFGKEGTQYKIEFASKGQEAHHEEYRVTKKHATIIAGSVGEFFDGLATSLNTYFYNLAVQNRYQFPDSIIFDIDPYLKTLPIVDPTQMSIADTNPTNDKTADFKKKTFQIPDNTSILDIIDRTMALSSYINVQTQNLSTDPTSQAKPTNVFKVMTQVEHGSVSDIYNDESTVTKKLGTYDVIGNRFPKIITYKIHQYTTWSAIHPLLPQFADSRQYASKVYNYLYTGQNTDIVDFKLNFDFTYNTTILSATNQYASTKAVKKTSVNENADNPAYLANNPKSSVLYSPQIVARQGGFPNLGKIPTATPNRFVPVINNANLTHGMGIISNPDAQKNIDAIKSLYTNAYANMVSLDLTIVGDPTLLKQDDWLYHPSPSDTSYTLQTKGGQQTYVLKTGHVATDLAEIIVTLIVNSVTDSDVDITGQGYMYNAGAANGSNSPLFAGQYRINTIESKFSQGKFEQILHLARLNNSDYATALSTIVGTDRTTNTPPWTTFAKSSTSVPASASGQTQSQASSSAAQSSANQRISTSTNQ